MKKLKRWMIERFLPVWLKGDLLKENDRLQAKVQDQVTHIRELNAYIEGLEFAIRSQRRITINAGEAKK